LPSNKTFRENKSNIVVCPRDCYDTCFFNASLNGHQIILEPMEIPFNIRALCPRVAKETERVYSKKRVLYPFIASDKRNKKFSRSNWNFVFDLIAKKIKATLERYGPEKILLLDYAGNRGLITRDLPQRFWYLIKAARTDYSICDAAGNLAIKLHYGRSYGATIDHIYNSKLLIYWGFNAAVTSLHNFLLAVKLRRERGVKIAVIDSLKTETARKADIWLRPKFGTDVYLALGIANYLVENELYDTEFVRNYTKGFEKFKEYIGDFTLEFIEEKTGIPKEEIENFAEIYAKLKPNIIHIGYGLQRRIGGGETVRAISLLPALIGLHRGFYYSNTDGLEIDIDYIRGTWLGSPSKIIPQSKIGTYLKNGDFRFVYIFLTNPVATYPNAETIKEGLLRDDVFVVVHETHWTDTAYCADVVLPAPTWLEKDDFVASYWHNYIGFSKKVIEPLGESKSELEVMWEIANRLGYKLEALFEDPYNVVKECIGEKTYQKLLTDGWDKLPYRKLNEYQTMSGKIEFTSSIAIKFGLSILPKPMEIKIPAEYPFTLVSSASLKYTHTQFEDVYGEIPPIILVSHEDMMKLGLSNGDIVTVKSKLDEVKLIVKESDKVPPGIVFTIRSCKTLDGKRVNALTTNETNELFGSSLNTTFVNLRKYPDQC